jgi:hypothetical protein
MSYFVVFGGPSIEPDLVGFTVWMFIDDVADSPIALVILRIDEIVLIVDVLQGWRLLQFGCCHLSK